MNTPPAGPAVEVGVRLAVDQVARSAYGRLVAWLAVQWRDIAAAEDALADAFVKALQTWPRDGIPTHPDAWLLTVAKRELLQKHRREKFLQDSRFTAMFSDISDEGGIEHLAQALPDYRLSLMLTCASPAIEETVRMPLMLQTVLGLRVDEIAPALLLSPGSLAQRLVRAKLRIKNQALPFIPGDAADLPEALHCVLEAIYGTFGISSDDVDGAEIRSQGLQQEAIYLCQLLCELLPQSAEAKGLLALMYFCRARRAAQTAEEHVFIPLAEQNKALWDRALIQTADHLLMQAHGLRQPGYFQLEAAVQSAHCHRLFSGQTPWHAIAELYRQINSYFPSLGSQVAGAVACAEAGKLPEAWDLLHQIDPARVRSFQPWWVAKAHLATLMGDKIAAYAAYTHAIGLSQQKKIIAHLTQKRDGL
ncbi:MAG TPA: sigma factor [Cellvibrionaceae bacterium]|nr:sigma factor [Cellvibrionaceae bacterium]